MMSIPNMMKKVSQYTVKGKKRQCIIIHRGKDKTVNTEIQAGQLSVSGERMCTTLVNRLEDQACPVNVWLGKLTALEHDPIGLTGQ